MFDYGRPASVQLAALLNRGGRELPIAADFLGGEIALAVSQSIELVRIPRAAVHANNHSDDSLSSDPLFSLVLNEN